MTGTDIALIITAGGTVITAIGGVLIALTTKRVHKIVNQSATDAKRYRAVLERVLTANGIALPEDQSIIMPETHHEG